MELVTVVTFDLPSEADLVRNLLESEGIQVAIADDNLVGADWFYTNAVGGVKLQVSAAEAKTAAALVQDYLANKKERQLAREQSTSEGTGASIEFVCEDCANTIAFPLALAGMVENCPACGVWVDIPESP